MSMHKDTMGWEHGKGAATLPCLNDCVIYATLYHTILLLLRYYTVSFIPHRLHISTLCPFDTLLISVLPVRYYIVIRCRVRQAGRYE